VDSPDLALLAAGANDVDSVYAAAAAEAAATEQRALRTLLTRMGVQVVTAPPDLIAPRLADHYLTLKATGRL
jgi:uncharacterized protein (DUF58 family)